MGRALTPALYVLCVLCVLAVCVSEDEDYCQQLKDLKLEKGRGSNLVQRNLTNEGERQVLRLCASDAAAVAAHAILRALLVHGLRYDEASIELNDTGCSLEELQKLQHNPPDEYWVLSLATPWLNESSSGDQCMKGACGLTGSRLDVIGRGVAPVTRRLLARLAPWAPLNCLQGWDTLKSPGCGFLEANTSYTSPCSDWTNTCSGQCMIVAIEPGDYEANQCKLAIKLARLYETSFQLASITELDVANSSYLFFDFDFLFNNNDHIRVIRISNSSETEPIPLAIGDVFALLRYGPLILNLARHFRPSDNMLQRVITNSSMLRLNTSACEAIVASESYEVFSNWLTCEDKFCNLNPAIRIYVCEEEEKKDSRYTNITEIVKSHWNNKDKFVIDLNTVMINCSKSDEVNSDLARVMTNFDLYNPLRGVIAMGAAAASPLAALSSEEAKVPLLLVWTPSRGAELASVRSTSPTLSVLSSAVSWLLNKCGWRRIALLREEGPSDVWKRSLGLADELSKSYKFLNKTMLVQPDTANSTLDGLQATDARVVLIDASATTARRVLVEAERRGLTIGSGYVWIVLGAAGNSSDSDWWPTNPEFSYITVTGGWRGGVAPGLNGSAPLRDALVQNFSGQNWPPHASALADAVLMMLEGTALMDKLHPERRDDFHRPLVDQLFFEILDNITVQGVTHDIRANSTPPVFAYRWNSSGPQLLVSWDGSNDTLPETLDELFSTVPDGPHCYSSHSGDEFYPHCHDVAWAVLVCALALGLPSLCAARSARRRRLKRRDRAVEERALLRGGHSAAEAAASAALAEYAVPREALQLLDELGNGYYGVVHQAVLRKPASAALGVAVKAPRADAPIGAAAELLREAALLATLRHDHVVRFTGVCWEGGPLVLMEHAFYGDLRRYLRARRTLAERARAGLPEPEAAHVAAPALTRLAREAAAALGYLAQRRLVHRDVRAANCLIDVRRSLKLADFGMARQLDNAGEDEYLCKRRAMFPVLWMAPESLSRGVFSSASDVWALGVLISELATLGDRPYGAWTTSRVLRHVREGGSPPLPTDAVASTRGVTAACWRRAPEERPTAAELVAYLAEHPRTVQPALAALQARADDTASVDVAPETDLYIDEWTAN